ncbi:glycosyltransferase, partial [Escherichia coli]|nr:glycosyltransferase [Escherichia coli]
MCDGTEQWVSVIETLIDSAELRHAVGLQGKQTVLARYSQEFIAENQVMPLVDDFNHPVETAKKQILSV